VDRELTRAARALLRSTGHLVAYVDSVVDRGKGTKDAARALADGAALTARSCRSS
jgi:hypothetical protein